MISTRVILEILYHTEASLLMRIYEPAPSRSQNMCDSEVFLSFNHCLPLVCLTLEILRYLLSGLSYPYSATLICTIFWTVMLFFLYFKPFRKRLFGSAIIF